MVHMGKTGSERASQLAAATLGLHSQYCSLLKCFLAALLIRRRLLLDLGAAMKLGYSYRF